MEPKLTKRQEDVLLNIHLKDQAHDGERTRDPWESYSKRHGEPVPAWGRPATYQRSGRAGGARYRMVERIAEMGFIPMRRYLSGRSYPQTGKLTASGARHLAARYPDLPGIADAVKEAEAREAEEAATAAKERQEATAARLERAAIRKEKRREAMAAVLQDFQVRHDLTGDQLEAMWLRIVDEEHSL